MCQLGSGSGRAGFGRIGRPTHIPSIMCISGAQKFALRLGSVSVQTVLVSPSSKPPIVFDRVTEMKEPCVLVR